MMADHECQRCGSVDWTDADYSGCSECRDLPVEFEFSLRSVGFVATAGERDGTDSFTFDGAALAWPFAGTEFDLHITIDKDGVELHELVKHETGWADPCPDCAGRLRNVSPTAISCHACGHIFARFAVQL